MASIAMEVFMDIVFLGLGAALALLTGLAVRYYKAVAG